MPRSERWQVVLGEVFEVAEQCARPVSAISCGIGGWEGANMVRRSGGSMGSARQEEVARTSGQNTSHPNTHKRSVPPGFRVRADITPCVTATSREAFFGVEEEGGVFLSFW